MAKIRQVGFSESVKALSYDQFKAKMQKSLTPDEIEHYAAVLGKTPPQQPVPKKGKATNVDETDTGIPL